VRLVTATVPFTATINILPFPQINIKGPVVHIHVFKILIKRRVKKQNEGCDTHIGLITSFKLKLYFICPVVTIRKKGIRTIKTANHNILYSAFVSFSQTHNIFQELGIMARYQGLKYSHQIFYIQI
jgi:hypothetical protein